MKKDEIECVWGKLRESVVNKGKKWKNTININTKINKKGNLSFYSIPSSKRETYNMGWRSNFYESKTTTLKPISNVSFIPHRPMRSN